MMRAKTEQKVKRWKDQRWLIDSVIQAVGMEWDQPRLNYTMYPAGPDAIGDFRTVGLRVREFAGAAHRREVKAQNFEKQGRNISARESYFIASLLYSAARCRSSRAMPKRSTTTPAWSPVTTSSPR